MRNLSLIITGAALSAAGGLATRLWRIGTVSGHRLSVSIVSMMSSSRRK